MEISSTSCISTAVQTSHIYVVYETNKSNAHGRLVVLLWIFSGTGQADHLGLDPPALGVAHDEVEGRFTCHVLRGPAGGCGEGVGKYCLN